MTNEELEAIRVLSVHMPQTAAALDVPALLAYIDELHGIVHDLRHEPGWELGRQEERRAVLDLMADKQIEWDTLRRQGQATLEVPIALASLMDAISHRGPVASHLAPDDLRRENESLRAALHRCVDALERASRDSDYLNPFGDVLDAVRLLLGDEV